MKKILPLLLCAFLLSGSQQMLGCSQEKKYEMTTFQLVFLRKGPQWTDKQSRELDQLQARHIEHLTRLGKAGQALALGPFTGEGDIRGIVVLAVPSPAEARSLTESDPAVMAGRLTVEVHPWFAAKGIMKFGEPSELSAYFITFLRRGPKWTAETTPELTNLQAAHMANIQKMAADGKLVIAGPFADNGDLRGVFVFRVGSLGEAKALSEADPMVKAGRMVADVYQWLVPKGSLP